MSRSFTAANNDRLRSASTPFSDPSGPLAMCCWFYSVTDAANQAIFNLVDDIGATAEQRKCGLSILGATAGDPVAMSYQHNTAATASTTTGYTANTWHHAAGWVYSVSTTRNVAAFIDGGDKGTSSASISAVTANATYVGINARENGALISPTDGRIAEVAIWDLSGWPGAGDSDKVANWETSALPSLSQGVVPSEFPLGLVGYWPLWGRHSPEIDLHPRSNNASNFGLTVTGATAGNHSPTTLWTPRIKVPRLSATFQSTVSFAASTAASLAALASTFGTHTESASQSYAATAQASAVALLDADCTAGETFAGVATRFCATTFAAEADAGLIASATTSAALLVDTQADVVATAQADTSATISQTINAGAVFDRQKATFVFLTESSTSSAAFVGQATAIGLITESSIPADTYATTIIIAGPFCVDAGDVFVSGSDISGVYSPGAAEAEAYQPGAVKLDVYASGAEVGQVYVASFTVEAGQVYSAGATSLDVYGSGGVGGVYLAGGVAGEGYQAGGVAGEAGC